LKDRSRCDRSSAVRGIQVPPLGSRRQACAPACPACASYGAPGRRYATCRLTGTLGTVKKVIELLICFLHPIAVVLIWIDLLTRRDIGAGAKLAWAIFAIVPLVPFLYVLTGGDLW